MVIFLYKRAIFIYFAFTFSSIIINEKRGNVKEGSDIYSETFLKIKWFTEQNPNELKNLTAEKLDQWIKKKGGLREDVITDGHCSRSMPDRRLHI